MVSVVSQRMVDDKKIGDKIKTNMEKWTQTEKWERRTKKILIFNLIKLRHGNSFLSNFERQENEVLIEKCSEEK